MIDVIIPVFRGFAATRRAIESVLASRCAQPCELVVIDDASPEPELSTWLRELSAAGRISLVVHPDNRGFVASVNEAMALHADRDVVLLNSDTEVPEAWLDRLVACAAREPQAATVTPFSNNATICSYPVFAASNPLPEGASVAALDKHFREENAGQCVEIPTAVGFCMYLSRAALDAIGAFDEEAFGRGYGEEVDFCMRASRAGFRHLLCADLFVFHEGEVSFGNGAPALRERAQAIVDERYPEFRPTLGQFIDREPARPLRRNVDLARLRQSRLPRLLFVTHSWGGGVERHVGDLAKLVAGHCEVLVLRPEGESSVTVKWLREGEEFQAWFDNLGGWASCVALLKSIAVERVHFHHIHGLPRQVLDLPDSLGVEFDVTLHDNWPICPRYHLADASGGYCGEARPEGCDRCLDEGPTQWSLGIAEWRDLFHGFLKRAARVVVPSSDLGERIQRHFPDVSPLQWPHPELRTAATRKFKVALLGGVSKIKGARLLEECVRDAKARKLPLHFHVVGHVDRPMATWPEMPLTIGGSYPDDKLVELVSLERPDAILFLSQVPESYSYTLTVAIQTGLPIVATRLGAFPERLETYHGHALVDPDLPAAAVNDVLLARLQEAAGRSSPGIAVAAD